MPDFLKKGLENLSKIWKGITTTQKIIGGVIVGAAVIAIVQGNCSVQMYLQSSI